FKIKSQVKSLEKVDLLIITSEENFNIFEKYKDFKLKMGFKTIVKKVEDIYLGYPGENNVIKIRNFIKEKYDQNDLEYVILGGNYDIIPVGIAFPTEGREHVPTDMFYSNLDGEVDDNRNGVYFEQTDFTDFYADVYVGRFPGSNTEELNAIVEKSISYFTDDATQRAGFNTSSLLAGFNIFFDDDGADLCEKVKEEFPSYFSINSFYEESSPDFSQETLINSLDLGYNIYYHQSHGDYNKVGQNENEWALWSDHFYNLNGVSGLYFIASCHPGDISYSGLSQKAMINPNGGCTNYIGSSVSDSPYASVYMHSIFFNQIFNGKDLGESLTYANLFAYGNLNYNSLGRFLLYSYNIQGDPSNKLFLNEPRNISILGINQFEKGTGTVNGVFNMAPNEIVEITLISDGEIISTTSTDTQSFVLEYENLFSDSVYVYYHSQECYLKEYGYIVSDNDSLEIEISDISINDPNNSGIVEVGENFSISFNMNVTLNSSNQDSIIVYLSDISDTNLVAINDSTKISIADLNTITPYLVFDLSYTPSSRAKQDSVVQCSINFQTAEKELVYNSELFIPLADPNLKLQSVKYTGLNVFPTFINDSKGMINKAEISLFEVIKEDLTQLKSTKVLNDILGFATVKDDTLFFAVDSTKTYNFQITINDDYIYSTSDFKVNTDTAENIVINSDYSPGKVNLSWTHDIIGDFKYNVYVDTQENFLNPVLKNFEPLNTTSYSFNDDQSSTLYIQIAVMDTNNVEFLRSDIQEMNFIPLYQDEFKISQYELFNPMYINDQLISNVFNSSVSGINSDGSLVNQTGVIHEAEVNGFSTSLQQGFAIGDVNGDGFDDMVNYSYNLGDSVLVKVIDLQTGVLIASKNVYGFIMENAPVLVDYDTDPEKEILMANFNGNISGFPKGAYIYVLDYEAGNLKIVPGFPLVSSYGQYYVHSPSLLDLDNNGVDEIIVDCYNKIEIYNSSTQASITTYDLSVGIQTTLSYCDINDDGQIELFAITESNGKIGKLLGYNFNGTTLIEIPEIIGGISLDMKASSFNDLLPPVSFPDLDDDSTVDIVALTSSKLYIYDNEFNSRANFPIDLDPRIETNNSSAPSFGDFDGDTILDILFMDANFRVWCYSGLTGLVLEGFPIQIEDIDRIEMTALPIMDLDGDNDLEFAIGTNNGVMLVYDYPTTTTRLDTYDKYRGDQFNSGLFGTILGAPTNIITAQIGSDLDISWDPVATATSYKIFVSDFPYTGFIELDTTSETNYLVLNPTDMKKFYYIIAVK
ncbi:MAG: hypothetical protein GQ534_04880, partial [Candidatus Delongbacteria bacterium]|nr:hypothetical protein [Candidatus Delongbacteria bacterium]